VIIADTDVVSEVMKAGPDPAVLARAHKIDPSDVTICVVTVEEIEGGLGRLPRGRRRRDLIQRWEALMDDFADAIADYNVPCRARDREAPGGG
jgi:predicted nucleic acid-binding protein